MNVGNIVNENLNIYTLNVKYLLELSTNILCTPADKN